MQELLASVKLLPLTVMPLIMSGALPLFQRVNCVLGPCVPASRSPKESKLGDGTRSGACPWPLNPITWVVLTELYLRPVT